MNNNDNVSIVRLERNDAQTGLISQMAQALKHRLRREGMDKMAAQLRDDYFALFTAGIVADIREIALREQEEPGKLAFTFKDNSLELVARANGTTVVTVNNVEILNDSDPGDEFAILYDGAWLIAIYDYERQLIAKREAVRRRAELVKAETFAAQIEKPY